MQLPDIAQHFTRFTVYVKDTRSLTPGGIAQSTGLRAEQLGPIVIAKNKILIDVHETGGNTLANISRSLGPLKNVVPQLFGFGCG